MTQPPRTRSECQGGPRPCPWARCRYHLDHPDAVTYQRRVVARAGRAPGAIHGGTCALDVADRGPHLLEEVAGILGVTRERVRQIEFAALRQLQRSVGEDVKDLLEEVEASRGEGLDCYAPRTAWT